MLLRAYLAHCIGAPCITRVLFGMMGSLSSSLHTQKRFQVGDLHVLDKTNNL